MNEVDVFIALGSNVGRRTRTLANALVQLRQHFEDVTSSAFYETEARIDEDQPSFLNAVVHVRSALFPEQILCILQRIEQHLGRTRDLSRPKGPRTLDLDLLFVGDLERHTPLLTLPHPGIPERRFVLEPLNELAPDFSFQNGPTIHTLLQACPDQGWVHPVTESTAKVAS